MAFAERLTRFARKPLSHKLLAIAATLCSPWRRSTAALEPTRLAVGTYWDLRRSRVRVSTSEQPGRDPARSSGPHEELELRRIPRCIFQTWKSKTEFPANFAYWLSTFDTKNPKFEHLIWDDDDNRKFIAFHFPWFLAAYDAYPREIYRADAVRIFFLYAFGGIYADMDAECLQPLDRLRDLGDVLLGRMGKNPDHPHSIPNATMASRPRQEFWLLAIWRMFLISRTRPLPEPDLATGPVVLKWAADQYLARNRLVPRLKVRLAIWAVASLLPPDLRPEPRISNVQILPGEEWYPIDWTDAGGRTIRKDVMESGLFDEEKKSKLFPRSSIVSYWSHSWGPQPF